MKWLAGGSLLLLLAAPAAAKWRTDNDTVRAAAADPAIAAALAAMDRVDAAILARDEAGFTGALAADVAVNNPGNVVATGAMVAKTYQAGRIDYASYDRLIEHVARQPSGEVVAMGWETVVPRNLAPNAGKTVRRRFTDVWRNDGGTWKLAIRQATIVEVR